MDIKKYFIDAEDEMNDKYLSYSGDDTDFDDDLFWKPLETVTSSNDNHAMLFASLRPAMPSGIVE